MMSAFAENVTTLLATYDNCLALLRSFKHRSKTTATGEAADPDAASVVAAQTRLRRSIRSDRTHISRVYESRLTQSGRRMEKGDARARSSLRRVLRRLSAALTQVLRTATGSPEPIVNYGTLELLSNASRIDAIKAIDGLSRRISDSGGVQKRQLSKTRSVESQSSMKSDTSSARSQASYSASSTGKEKTNKSRRKGRDRDSKQLHKEKAKDKSKRAKGRNKTNGQKKVQLPASEEEDPRTRAREQGAEMEDERLELTEGDASRQPPVAVASPHNNPPGLSPRVRMAPTSPKRISIASFASDTTKLGEIVRRPGLDTVIDEEFEIRPVYPLRPYAPTTPERKKGFWSRLAGRS